MENRRIAIQIMRSVLAIVVGEIVLYAGTWFVQEWIFGHVTYSDSLPTLVGAGLLTPIAAVGAGFAVALIAGTRPYLHLVPMCSLIIAETGYLYSRGLVDGPIWFEASAGLSLILGAIGGACSRPGRVARPHGLSDNDQRSKWAKRRFVRIGLTAPIQTNRATSFHPMSRDSFVPTFCARIDFGRRCVTVTIQQRVMNAHRDINGRG